MRETILEGDGYINGITGSFNMFFDGFEGFIMSIAFLGEVSEMHMFETAMADMLKKLATFRIGKVT